MSIDRTAHVLGPLLDDEHEAYRDSLRQFLSREISGDTEHELTVDLATVVRSAGTHGFVGLTVPEEHDGLGLDDLRFRLVRAQETIGRGIGGLGVCLGRHDDLVVPLLVAGSDAGAEVGEWLATVASGDLVTALVDHPSVQARPLASGWTLHGTAATVVNGSAAGLFVVVVRGEHGTTLVAVPADAAGVTRDRGTALVGVSTADVADIRFDGTPVSASAVIGEVDDGDRLLTGPIADERLLIAAGAVTAGRRALALTLDYTHERRAFGQPIASFGNSRQMIGDVVAQLDLAEVFVEATVRSRLAGDVAPRAAAVAKLRATCALEAAVDSGVQLHGGYGYMLEYPISRAYTDAALLALHGGTSARLRDEIADAAGD